MASPARIRSTIATIVDTSDELLPLRVFHKALADVNRLRIVRHLADGPATVTELIDRVGLSQPLVSWHVRRLRAAGVVETRRAGRETICRLRPQVWDEMAAAERILLGLEGARRDPASPGQAVPSRPSATSAAPAPARRTRAATGANTPAPTPEVVR